MSDFEVSGVPAAAPVVPGVAREATRGAAGARGKAEPGATEGEGTVRIQHTRVAFSIGEDHEVVIRLVDGETNEVVREIPPEELRQVANRLGRPTGGLIERVA